MKSNSGFLDLSPSVKLGLAIAGAATVCGALFTLLHSRPMVLAIMVVGIVLVGVLLVACRYVLERRKKRKAAPLERGIKDNSGSVPQNVSEPAQRANLDGLRRNFESGVEKFRSAGRDLYSLPWYLVAGESGSGKTEAIRHCNISFPSGLQDPLQGVGGTINMNWWFTNHAVILDTAGKMFFQEVETGGSGEWREFLGLLKRNRPNEPINGLLLVVPADSLIKDTAEEIQHKGGKIAQQLDLIQRTLDIRFPVFVVITKCDLINGFRELFENLNDPQLQHQILGWSNPAQLDEPFNPELVDQHLEHVVQRIRRRRLGLVLDPPRSDDPAARRIDQVDALFAAPHSLAKLAPRLRLYMEKIFVAGEWSARPLFIRGIYFTSAMREGSALDAELAEALGVPVDRLPEGRVWDRNRSYFLRDLFMDKVFRERGLVTRATNANRQHRRRKAIVMSVAMAGVVILIALTWLGIHSFNKSIGSELHYWTAGEDAKSWTGTYWRPIVEAEYNGSANYLYRDKLVVGNSEMRTMTFHLRVHELVGADIHVPGIFSFAAVFGKGFNDTRRQTQQTLFERSVVAPVVDGARSKMTLPENRRQEVPPWSSKATKALVQLMKIEARQLKPDAKEAPRLDVEPMIEFVLDRKTENDEKGTDASRQGAEQFAKDKAELAKLVAANTHWPAAAFGAGTEQSREAIKAGVGSFIAYLPDFQKGGDADVADDFIKQLKAEYDNLGKLGDLKTALKDSAAAEDAALKLIVPKAAGDQPAPEPASAEELARIVDSAKAELKKIEAARSKAGKVSGALGDTTLEAAFDAAKGKVCALYYPTPEKPPQILSEVIPAAELILGDKAEKYAAASDYRRLLNKLQAAKKPDESNPTRKLFVDVGIEILTKISEHLEQFPALADADVKTLDEELLVRVSDKGKEIKAVVGALRERSPNDPALAAALDQSRLLPALEASPRLHDVRFLMYMLANVQLGREKRAVKPNAVTQKDLEDQLDQIARDNAWSADMITRTMGVAEKKARVQEAGGCALLLVKLDKKQRLYNLVNDLLAAAPKSAEEFENAVAESAPAGGLERPKVAMTSMQGRTFDPKFCPSDGLKGRLASYGVLDGLLQQKLDLIDRDRLESRHQDALASRKAYLENYAKYWKEIVFTDLEIKLESWDDCRKQFKSPAFEAFQGLAKLGDAVNQALEAVGEKPTYKKPESVFVDACDRVLGVWSRLSADPLEARKAILGAADFTRTYMPFPDQPREEFVRKYWHDVTLKAIDKLAQETGTIAKGEIENIKKYAKFPLDKPRAGEEQLAPEDVDRVVVSLAKIKIDSKQELDAPVLPLRDIVTPKEQAWISRIDAMLAALPRKGQTLNCKISVLSAKSQDAANQWPVVSVVQGDAGRESAINIRDVKEDKELATVDCPGKAVSFRFYTHLDRPKENSLVVGLPDQWSCLQLLHKGRTAECEWQPEDRSEDGKTFTVKLGVKGANAVSRTLYVKLEFQKGLPKTEDWPSDEDFAP